MSKYPMIFKAEPAPRPPTFAADAIQAESLRRLVHRTWSGDLPATCAALQAHLARYDTRRARLATLIGASLHVDGPNQLQRHVVSLGNVKMRMTLGE